MAVGRYAIISRDGTVENIILWDESDEPKFAAGAAVRIKSGEDAVIGDDFDGERFTRPMAVLIDLAKVRAHSVEALSTEFVHLSASMFIGPNEREAMRTTALAGARLIEAANTYEEVLAATKEAFATLHSHTR
jgi:hypothetical protein